MDRDQSVSLEITITRRFNATPEEVFAQWIDPEALKDWFAPETYTGLSSAADPREGGAWRVEFQAPTGERLIEHGIYKEIVPHSKLVMTLHQSFKADAPELTILVSLEPASGGTLMHFRQTGFVSPDHRDGVAEGWVGCMDKLAARLADDPESVVEI